MTAPRRLQLRRGNSTAVSTYTGAAGEVVIDTTNWTLRVHDGVTQGGYVVTANTTSLNANITQANLGLKGYVDLANTIQSQQISAANLGMKGYVDSVSNQSIYGNSNVKSYFTEGFDGNIIPSANLTYSLGSLTRQWKDLFVSNNTIYVGGVPLSIDNTGNLTVNGNTIPTVAYVNTAVANVTVDLSSYALNANVTAANVGLKGYVDQANTIQLAQISSANVGMKGYVDQQITDLIGGAPSILDTLNEIAASINDDANVYTSLVNSIATANTALKGYVDQANTIQSAQLTSANLGIIGYIDQANTIQSQQLSAANIGIIGYIDQANSIQSVVITEANLGMKGYVDSIAYGNAEVKTYLATEPGDAQRLIQGYYANLDLGATAELYSFGVTSKSYFGHDGYQGDPGISTVIADNYFIKISTYNGAYNWTFDNAGNLTLPGNVAAINYANGSPVSFSGGSSYSNVQVATYLPTYTGTLAGGTLNLAGQDGTTVADFQTGAATNQIITLSSDYTFSIKAGDGAGNRGHLVLESGRNSRVKINGNGSNVLITAGNGTQSSTWTFANSGVLTFPDGTTQSTAGGTGSNYGNVNVKAYTESMGFQNYGNSNVTAYLNATGYNLYSNVNVAVYLSTATINTTGNITAQNLTGNISITGNVTGTSANVTLQAGVYTSVFDNQGNVRLPTAYVSGNVTANYFIGNGSQLTGLDTVYLLEAYASVTYTLPGSFTQDPCRYSVVSSNVNVSSSWFDTSTYTFTPQKAGYWEITAAYDVYRNAEASILLKKNNSIVATAGSFNAVAQQVTKIIYLNGSTDSANVFNVGGAALERAQFDGRSWFQARWIGA